MSEKFSARNRIKCKITNVDKSDLLGKIQLSTLENSIVTVVITKDALEKFNITIGDEIKVICKPTVVMIENIK
ncbi:MAG: TOBE domain-containing protein [Candidatus Helarchaeota archaeon]